MTRMSRYNLADIQSSTLLFASDSLDAMDDVVQALVRRDEPTVLQELTLSVQRADESEFVEFSDREIVRALQAMKAVDLAATRR
jgi:hypothetical protein